ncbi:MAG: hypothetical protein JWP87_62 [Labilithrix sp.]|nr:hypothetical protein [Labilithrix sp.]
MRLDDRSRRSRGSVTAVIAFASLLLLGCPKSSQSGTGAGAADASAADGARTDAPLALATSDAGADAAAGGGGGEDVEPVYPIETNAPAVPLAEKLCNALTAVPEKKRAACCKTSPSIVLVEPCTRQLSAAIRHNALSLDEKDVDACIAAFDKALDGCDWVGPFRAGPPPACQGIFKGKLAAGQKCRSSLECAGELRCKDLGPTSAGKCGPAGTGVETSCGGTVDSLAEYTKQNDVDRRHPECKDRCIKHKCQAGIAEGGACLISSDCQDGTQCLDVAGAAPTKNGQLPKKCVAKAPSKEGEPCPGGVCEGTLQCIRGKCAARKAGGEACTDDFECRGGCVKDGGTKGTCGMRCDIR